MKGHPDIRVGEDSLTGNYSKTLKLVSQRKVQLALKKNCKGIPEHLQEVFSHLLTYCMVQSPS